MYSIKITVKSQIREKQKEILFQTAAEAGAEADFKDTSCEISGSGKDLETLSYLIGAAIGSFEPDEIVKLMILFENA